MNAVPGRADGAPPRLAVVGIGEDGWDGLGAAARAALQRARVILGSERQLALLPGAVTAERRPWPRPMSVLLDPFVAALAAGGDPSDYAILASGDPMLHGIGATLARQLGPARLSVYPAPSAFSLACARLGWPQHTTPLVSRVADPSTPAIDAVLGSGRAVVYVPGDGGARDLAEHLRGAGLGDARLVVMERLGGPSERLIETTATDWTASADPLHLVAVELVAGPDGAAPHATANDGDAAAQRLQSTVPGLPDELYGGDGQLTRAEVRAVALAALGPRPGELLWDVGAGSGTIAVEWCRGAPQARAIAIEQRADRSETIAANARALGAGGRVSVVHGAVPGALAELEQPDAIFIGGGVDSPGVLETCWDALAPGGRLVANVVTLEGEQALALAMATHGGRLVRLEFAHAEPLGRFQGWKPQRPVVQWSAVKGVATPPSSVPDEPATA